MTTKPLGPGFKLKDGKLTKRAPRMAPVLAAAKHKQAARKEKAWKRKSRQASTT